MLKVGKALPLVVVAWVACVGCRAPMSAWQGDARARGGFIVGGGLVQPKDSAQDDATSAEVSG